MSCKSSIKLYNTMYCFPGMMFNDNVNERNIFAFPECSAQSSLQILSFQKYLSICYLLLLVKWSQDDNTTRMEEPNSNPWTQTHQRSLPNKNILSPPHSGRKHINRKQCLPVWNCLDHFGPFWTVLKYFETAFTSHTNQEQLKQVQTSSILFKPTQNKLNQYGAISCYILRNLCKYYQVFASCLILYDIMHYLSQNAFVLFHVFTCCGCTSNLLVMLENEIKSKLQ